MPSCTDITSPQVLTHFGLSHNHLRISPCHAHFATNGASADHDLVTSLNGLPTGAVMTLDYKSVNVLESVP